MIRFTITGRLRMIMPVVVACVIAQPASAQTKSWKLSVDPGDQVSGESLIVAPITEEIAPGRYLLETGAEGGKPVSQAQVFKEDGVSYLALDLPDPAVTSAGTFRLSPAGGDDAETPKVALIPDRTNVAIKIDGKLFTEYRTDEGPKPFLYPLIGPTGVSYTRSFPMKDVEGEKKDHPHHRSFWFTHGKVNGIDFWAEPKKSPFGSIKETSRKPLIQGPVLGRLHTTDDWLSPSGEKVCEDERVLTIYHSRKGRVLDFDIKIKASVGPVEFGQTKEGMFGVRVASSMDVTKKEGGKIVTSEGLTDEKAWGKPASWVDYSGPVDGKTVGIAILNHPSSFRYPTTWHVRTYGLFAANPFGGQDFGATESAAYTIPKGREIRFRYRVILHQGDAESAGVARAFRAYAHPPRVSLAAD